MNLETMSPPVEERPHKSSWRDSMPSPPDFIEIKDFRLEDFAPALGDIDSDDTSCCGRRLRSYGSMRRVWYALMMWTMLLVVSLSKGKVDDRDLNFDVIFNSTMFPHLDQQLRRLQSDASALFNSTLFPNIEYHLSRLNYSIRMQNSNQDEMPGVKLSKAGAKAHYPIVLVPGFVTSGLELWEGEDCAKKYFRQRIWGAFGTQVRGFLTETECWRRHLSLDPITGMDPEGIRLRSAHGFEAADYFMSGYWVWYKLIQNLAAVGYDGSIMSMEPYDWRLAYPLLEKRDGYFTKLMYKIEAMHKTTGKKVVIASHSMGSSLMTYFLAWVTSAEKEGGGGGGYDWADKHIYSLVNIAGPMLGVPKSVTTIMSGEMRDTNVLMGTFGSMLEQFFGRRRRRDLWASWGALWGMLPKGGIELWGPGADISCSEGMMPRGLECVPVSEADPAATAPFIAFLDDQEDLESTQMNNCTTTEQDSTLQKVISKYMQISNWSVDETLAFLKDWGAGYGEKHSGVRYHSLDRHDGQREWSDPTRTPLPYAPSMKLYCLYGVGIETERSFIYKRNHETVDDGNGTRECSSPPVDLPFVMDGSLSNQDHNIAYGVKTVDGDGSITLLSLGYMCVDGWKKDHLNPSGIQVITREYKHHQEFSVDDPMRGGPKSAEHVDILGNLDMTEDLLRIVTNFEASTVQTKIVSDIEDIAANINAHPIGGLKPPSTTRLRKVGTLLEKMRKRASYML